LQADIPTDFADFVRSRVFPCIGAKSSLALGHLQTLEVGAIGSSDNDRAIHAAIDAFGATVRARVNPGMDSFACLFTAGKQMSESEFETVLWRRLQALHDIDADDGQSWSCDVSRNPASPKFSMSIAGNAFFVVGLHPGASRPARRFSRPALVFNPHLQFDKLRADGRYQSMQTAVRRRELDTFGSINPMLSDFGARGEAAQYSGRKVSDKWICPFRPKA
jgi:FPC/CPF motif-containing protein YcgG